MNPELLKAYALSFLGKPYLYGGDDPIFGLDCSGFVSELLRASGVIKWNERLNAQQLYNLFHFQKFSSKPEFGALAFYGRSATAVSHVAFCLDSVTMIEAGGGDSTTTNMDLASRKNAFVRMRPIEFRRDFLCTAKLG